MSAASTYTFPDDNIDPREKGFKWILQYCKAAWSSGSNKSFSVFYNDAIRYREIKDYALGKQNISKYKKFSQPDVLKSRTDQNRDATVVPLIPRYRNRSLSKLLQRNFEINAFAVDAQAKVEQDEELNKLRVKIAMSEALKAADSPLQNHMAVQLSDKEPKDEDQLNMMLQFGWKHNICMDMELGVQWAFNYNKFESERIRAVEDLYDFGVAGYRVWIDETGKPRFRSVSADNLIVSYCEKPDFSDASFIGEAVYMNVSDLVPYFNGDQIKQICNSVVGKYNNPPEVNFEIVRYYDKFKVLVMDLQFLSYNTTVFEQSKDKYGNERFTRSSFNNGQKTDNGGSSKPVYINSTKKVIYQAKWVVGTDLMYDYGLARNQVRKESSWWDTQFDFVLETYTFNKMRFVGITEGLIPLADDYYETCQKLQDLKRRMQPYMMELNLDALENVAIGDGGQQWTVPQLMDLFVKRGILVYRGKSLFDAQNNTPQKPADIKPTSLGQELVGLRNELLAIKEEMAELSGYNAATLGNPNPKMLNAGYEAAQAATNDSLWLVSEADKRLALRLADLIVMKCQIVVKMGKISGFSRALGDSVVRMFEMNPDISMHEFAIFVEDGVSPVEKQQLIMDMNTFNQEGLLEPQDRIMIESCRSLKHAQMLLSYLVSKRKIEQQQIAQQQIMQNAQVQQQSLMTASQMKIQEMQAEHQMKMEEINAKGYWDLQNSNVKAQSTQSAAQISGMAKVVTQNVIEESKSDQKDVDFLMHTQKIQQMNEAAKMKTNSQKTSK